MPKVTGITEERFSNIYRSQDKGESFALLGSADVPDRHFDEHMVVELREGRLLMLVRTDYGLGKSYSHDKGKTWTPGVDSGLGGPNSRFFIRRLKSGRILLVNHYKFEIRKDINVQFPGRNNLCAMLSEDEGQSWKGFLMLDERDDVSYPDSTEDDQGNIYIIYDRERLKAREILMAKIREEDILAGKIINKESRMRVVVDKL
jgi:predicted neuraminidase